MTRTILIALAILIAMPMTLANAKQRHHRHYRTAVQTNENIVCRHNTIKVGTAYGIYICVDSRFSSNFQSFFSSLKARGVQVTEIICQAYGHAPGSNHIGGGACDVNQRAKNKTIPAMYHAGDLIREAGLYDGCSYRDCGHIEAMRGLGNYGYTKTARRHHRSHNKRYANR